MKKIKQLPGISSELEIQVKKLQYLAKELSDFAAELEKKSDLEISFSGLRSSTQTPANLVSNIITFPSCPPRKAKETTPTALSGWILATPGAPLPEGLDDCRPDLQRDGLILLSWDKRRTERGEYYTAYWVTSVGIPRFYASLPLNKEEFPFACPNHKSYAAEDGIEFYGQDAPLYVVHVAPELMMHNPQHRKLRLEHIQMLKEQGSAADFNYVYLLKTEKRRDLMNKKAGKETQTDAGQRGFCPYPGATG